MMTMQRNSTGFGSALKSDVHNIMESGQFYTTPEVCRELRSIDKGAQHIQLDKDILRSSTWSKKFEPERLAWEEQASGAVLGKASSAMGHIKSNMGRESVGRMMDNQVRHTHHAAVQNLKAVNKELDPFVGQSVDRLQQFCDQMGVTDRYSGYRNNLNRSRSSQPGRGYSWVGSAARQSHARQSHAPPAAARSQSARLAAHTFQEPVRHVTFSAQPSMERRSNPAAGKSLQERCGINTRFPGDTEYMTRYRGPPPADLAKGYIVNPLPEFGLAGRPMALHLYEKHGTEYQGRYQFPDGSAITKFPWLRK